MALAVEAAPAAAFVMAGPDLLFQLPITARGLTKTRIELKLFQTHILQDSCKLIRCLTNPLTSAAHVPQGDPN